MDWKVALRNATFLFLFILKIMKYGYCCANQTHVILCSKKVLCSYKSEIFRRRHW